MVVGRKVSAESRWAGVRYISTILTINIETVKLFHVRTRGGLACKERPFKLFQNCILEFIILGQAHAKVSGL